MNILYLRYMTLACSLIAVTGAHAQCAGAKYEKGPSRRVEILQVDNRERSTMVYMAYTTPDSDDWEEASRVMSVEDGAFIRVEGSDKRYHMLSAVNMPVSSEAVNRWMMFDRRSQRHQFVLEFERIPEGRPFDMIENANDSNALNFYGVTYVPADSGACVDVDEYVAGYPVKEGGRYVVEGDTVAYVRINDVVVSILPSLSKQYGKFFSMNIWVQNFSNKSIFFNPGNIKAVGHDFKVYKPKNSYMSLKEELHVLTHEEYDKIVKRKQTWNNVGMALAEGMTAGGAGMSASTTSCVVHAYALGGSSYYTTYYYGQAVTTTYNAAAAYAARQRAVENCENYANGQRLIMERLGKGYVKMNTIAPNTCYSGYFNIKYGKMAGMSLDVVIGGEVYPFTFE